MSDKFIAIAFYHNQPPFETAAIVWNEARSFDSATPISEVWKWTQKPSGVFLTRLEIRPESQAVGEKEK